MKHKRIFSAALVTLLMLSLSGCNSAKMTVASLRSKLGGLDMTIRTYDSDSQVIDEVHGKSIDIRRSKKFDTVIDGQSQKDSSVIDITIGDSTMTHVGSSLIASEDSLTDVLDLYNKSVTVDSDELAVPIINRVAANLDNLTTGRDKLVLIRSQDGYPLATYTGNDVSTFAVDIPKTTAFMIDGDVLLVYRCDYTIYDTALLK